MKICPFLLFYISYRIKALSHWRKDIKPCHPQSTDEDILQVGAGTEYPLTKVQNTSKAQNIRDLLVLSKQKNHWEGSTCKTWGWSTYLRLGLKQNNGKHLHSTPQHQASKLKKQATAVFKRMERTFMMVQWIRIQLPMQRTWVWSLIQEDSTCHGATKAHVPQLLKPMHLQPELCNKKSHQIRRPSTSTKSSPHSLHSNEEPAQPKINNK